MRIIMVLAALASGAARADRVPAGPFPVGGTDAVLQYDDGTVAWLTWGGEYRGTWFHLADFYPGFDDFVVDTLEFWFFHFPSYPWDTSSFFAALYSGDDAGPVTELFSTSAVAHHYMPCYVPVVPPVEAGGDFWVLMGTGLSAGGWPSIVADGTPQAVADHSFFSDDFIAWEPWIIQGPHACDYFIRTHGDPVSETLECATWGSIKGLFGR